MSDLRGTNPREWIGATQEEQLLLLPSGNEIVVKEVDLIALILESDDEGIPEPMVNIVTQRFESAKMNGSSKPDSDIAIETQDYLKHNRAAFGRFINLIVKAASVSPKLVDGDANPDNDEMNIARLSMNDRVYIFERVLPGKEAAAGGQFPGKTGAGVAAVRTGKDVPKKSEPNPGADE